MHHWDHDPDMSNILPRANCCYPDSTVGLHELASMVGLKFGSHCAEQQQTPETNFRHHARARACSREL